MITVVNRSSIGCQRLPPMSTNLRLWLRAATTTPTLRTSSLIKFLPSNNRWQDNLLPIRLSRAIKILPLSPPLTTMASQLLFLLVSLLELALLPRTNSAVSL
jgi:hypothetical protein